MSDFNIRILIVVVFVGCISFFNAHAANVNERIKYHSKGKTKYLVIGISHYLDPDIPHMQLPHRDAELFAGFVRSQSEKKLNVENLKLLTNNEATNAQVASLLDWLIDGMSSHDTCILYFSGYCGQLGQNKLLPSKLYFYDTSLNVYNAASFDVFNQFVAIAKLRKIKFKLFANLYPLILSSTLDSAYPAQLKIKQESKKAKNMIFLNTVKDSLFYSNYGNAGNTKFSLGYFLLDGMLGFADYNKDQKLTWQELELYCKTQMIPEETSPGVLFILTSSPSILITEINPKYLNQSIHSNKNIFPAIVNFEIDKSSGNLLEKMPEHVRLLYQDFVVALKLGHFLTPPDNNARQLYDTLMNIPEFSEMKKEITRKFTAALIDETQQALNGYLNTDSRELNNRRNRYNQYKAYAEYLDLASKILGSRHFMYKIITAKKYYFLGLHQRILAQQTNDIALFNKALILQQQALENEPEAAFIQNELGVNYSSMRQAEQAEKFFRIAMNLSPSWSVPYTNMAILLLSENPNEALKFAKKAMELTPKNSFVYNVLGMVYTRKDDLQKAESAILKALKLDPDYSDAYYNMACIKAKQGDYNAAAMNLETAIQKGFDNLEHAMQDRDLVELRDQEVWKVLEMRYFNKK